MGQPQAEFAVGDRVVYIGFNTPVYGTIRAISIELPTDNRQGVEVRVYTVELDEGGVFTGLSRHLRRA